VVNIKLATGKPLTRDRLIAEANPVCELLKTQLAAIVISTQQGWAQLLPIAACERQTAEAELDKLVAPATMASDWKRVVTDMQILADYTIKASEDAKAHITLEQSLLSSFEKTQKRMEAIAKHNGVIGCSQIS
jgi:hypothetical protein